MMKMENRNKSEASIRYSTTVSDKIINGLNDKSTWNLWISKFKPIAGNAMRRNREVPTTV